MGAFVIGDAELRAKSALFSLLFLGTLQFAGVAINPLSYLCLVISIGMLVDFLMHVILRYYESKEKTREAKVKDTLRTLGASIFVGGLTTCLSVVPLAFSSSEILRTVFIAFFALVTLGVAHGLILMPVLLAYLGPTVCVRMNQKELTRERRMDEPEHICESRNQKLAFVGLEEEEEVDVDRVPQDSATSPVIVASASTFESVEGDLPTCPNGSRAAAAAAILAFMDDVKIVPAVEDDVDSPHSSSSFITAVGDDEHFRNPPDAPELGIRSKAKSTSFSHPDHVDSTVSISV